MKLLKDLGSEAKCSAIITPPWTGTLYYGRGLGEIIDHLPKIHSFILYVIVITYNTIVYILYNIHWDPSVVSLL